MPTETQEFITTALLRQQLVLHVLIRVGARVWLVLSPLGWAHSTPLRLLAVAFIGYDLLLAWGIRTGRLASLAPRFVLDALDVTLWALLCRADQPFSAAVVVAVPLVMVTAIRRGILADAAAALTLTAVVSTARELAHAKPFIADTMVYLGLSILLGALMPALLRNEAVRQERQAVARSEADLVAATLAGRNEVLTGVGADIIDDLQTSIMQLTAANVNAAATLRAAVGRYKQQLGEQTRQGAAYLRDALDLYAAEARTFEPRVARHVFFDLPSAAGTCVLSLHQASRLAERLRAAGVTGIVRVEVLRAVAGRSIELQIGDVRVSLPATGRSRIRLSVAPIGTVCLALYVLTLSNPAYTAVPLSLTLPLAAVIIMYAVCGLLLLRRFGPTSEPWLAVAALLPFALVALVTLNAATMAGPPRLTLLGPLAGLAMLLGTVVAPVRAVRAAQAGLLVAAALAVWSAPPLTARYIAAELIWPLIAYLGAFLTARAVAGLGAQLSEQLTDRWRDATAEARRTAVRQEVEYLLDVTRQGERLCTMAEVGPIRDNVHAELTRLRDGLATLGRQLA